MKRLSGVSPQFFLLVGKWWSRSFWKRKKIWLLPSCSSWSWPPDLMPGQVGEARMTPKLGCRTGRWSKNEPRFGCRTGRWCKNDPQIRCSGWSEGWKWPPNLMPGVVGRGKRPPRFDARSGRKGKTTPQIWCSGWSEAWKWPPDLNWWLNADSKIDLFINEFSFGSSFEGGNLFDDLDFLRRIGVR